MISNQPLHLATIRHFTATALLVACVGLSCAGSPVTEVDPDELAHGADPAIEALGPNVDVVARIPLADTGEPVARLLFAEETFDPHASPYEVPELQFHPEQQRAAFDPDIPLPVKPGSGAAYKCPHHPSLRASREGNCPLCSRTLEREKRDSPGLFGDNELDGYACPNHPEFAAGEPTICPICDEDLVAVDDTDDVDEEQPEHELLTVDADDWPRWPGSLQELGARVNLTTLLRGVPDRRRFRRIRGYATPHPSRVLAPLNVDDVTGPAWVGYSTDPGTRAFFDHADAATARFDADDDRHWIPRVTATVAIPLTSAHEHAEQYELLCMDEDQPVCERLVDVYADDGVLVIELIAAHPSDQSFDDVAAAHRTQLADRADGAPRGLLQRVGHGSATGALATFLNHDGPGYYARIDGLRRITVAEYLVDNYTADADDYDRMATMMRALRTGVYGDLAPGRDDVAVLATVGDDGLSVDSFSSHTEAAADPDTDHTEQLPAPRLDDTISTFATWRFGAEPLTDDIDQPGAETAWEPSLPDAHTRRQARQLARAHAEWFQGTMFALIAQPPALDFDRIAAGAGLEHIVEDLLGNLSGTAEEAVGAAFQAASATYPDVFGDRWQRNPDFAPVVSALKSYHPDAAAMTLGRVATDDIDPQPRTAMALELYYRDPATVETMKPLIDLISNAGTGDRSQTELDAEVTDIDGYRVVRLAVNLDLDQFSDQPDYGSIGGEFQWTEAPDEFRDNLDRAFAESFSGAFPPERLSWEGATAETLTGWRLNFGTPQPTTEPVQTPPVPVDEARLCAGRAQAAITSLFDAGEHRQMGLERRHSELQDRRRQARRFQRALSGGGVDIDEVADAFRAVELPVAHALLTAEHHATFGTNLDNVVDTLNDCADDHPDSADQFHNAADNWKKWGDRVLQLAE